MGQRNRELLEAWAGRDPMIGLHPPSLADYERAMANSEHAIHRGGRADAGAASAGPLVTVLTAVRNGAAQIAASFASVARQSYGAIEHIVIDGRSTDATVDIIRAHESQLACWLSEPDLGFYDAINKGIALSKGKYIKILNADDELPPDALTQTVQAFAEHGEGVCVKGLMELIDGEGRVLGVAGPDDKTAFEHPEFPPLHPTWCVPRRVYAEHGLYWLRYSVAADYEMYHRLLAAGVPFHHVPSVLASFRSGGMSSGYTGVFEALEINRHYLGRVRAASVTAVFLAKKARLAALYAVLGRKRGEQWHAIARNAFRSAFGS